MTSQPFQVLLEREEPSELTAIDLSTCPIDNLAIHVLRLACANLMTLLIEGCMYVLKGEMKLLVMHANTLHNKGCHR